MDPPFKNFDFLINLKIIKKNKIYKKNHVVVIHRENKTKDDYKDILEIIDKKNYGRSEIIFGVFN